MSNKSNNNDYSLTYSILSIIFYIVALVLTLIFFDFKMVLVILVWLYANNLQNADNRMKKKQ